MSNYSPSIQKLFSLFLLVTIDSKLIYKIYIQQKYGIIIKSYPSFLVLIKIQLQTHRLTLKNQKDKINSFI